MSAYICDSEHISQLADYLCFPDPDAPRAFVGRNPEDVGHQLWNLNVEAVWQRYDGPREELPGPVPFGFAYVTHAWAVPTGQTLRSLECFLYQCSEGDVPERELFKTLERFADHLRRELLDRWCPEYKAAEWGAYEPPKDKPVVLSISAMMRTGKGKR